MTDQQLLKRSQTRSCTARKIKQFDRDDTIRRLFAEDGTHGDFRLAEHVARPTAESSFDVATDGETLYVSVLYWEAGEYFGTGVQSPNEDGAGNHCVEVIFCPCGDQLGYLQFGAGPGSDSWYNQYWPYLDGRPNLAARPCWQVDFQFEHLHADLAWIVVFQFPLDAIRLPGYDGPLGFNVMRTQMRHNESACWNHASGSGFSDGSGCGLLHLPGTPAIEVQTPTSPPSPATPDLAVTYDWPDEMVGGPYSPDVLRHEFTYLRDHGVNRIYWLDYPSRNPYGNYVGSKIMPQRTEHYRLTHEAFGGDVMPIACQLAHELGMSFLTICKPYDLNDFVSFHKERPDLWFQRNPAWTQLWKPSDAPLDLALYADNDAPLTFDHASIEVWISDDNTAYTCVDGVTVSTKIVERPRYQLTPAGKIPCGGTEQVRRILLSGLVTSARYLAVCFPGAAQPGTFGNQEFLLAETELPVELARFPRAGGFREHGFAYETDTHAAVWSDQSDFAIKRRALPAGNAIGLRLGHDPGMPQMLDPSHPEVRDFWIRLWIDRAIAAGCDGVDVRIAHHHLCTYWPAFGYAEPVLAVFRDRYGREPEPNAADTIAIQAIRGEFHTTFLREASQRLHGAGKLLEAHVEARMRAHVEVTAYTGIRWDWARWIEEGLIDGINLKYLCPANPFVQEELLPAARQAGIPIRCISAIGDPRSQPRTPEWAVEQLRLCRLLGIAALNLYETWVYLRTTPRGEWLPRGCARAIFAALKEELQTP